MVCIRLVSLIKLNEWNAGLTSAGESSLNNGLTTSVTPIYNKKKNNLCYHYDINVLEKIS